MIGANIDMRSNGSLPTRTLGRCGIEVAALGVGCWGIGGEDSNLGLPMGWSGTDDDASLAGLEAAYRCGANLYDTADVYGHGRSERLIGRLVSQVPRESLVLSSKVGYFAGTAEHGYAPNHMRRQLEQTLDNLRTDHLDIYFLHHSEFGPDDRYLAGAIDTVRALQTEGLVRAVGMRGPHRFALERLTTAPSLRGDKIARFRALFQAVRPDVLAVRDNLLTPSQRSQGIFTFAEDQGCGVIVNKALSQGLLTGTHDALAPRAYGPGDHRNRKRWFDPDGVAIVSDGLQELRELMGPGRRDLIRIALWSCLTRSPHTAVLVGFTRPEQIQESLTALGPEPEPDTIEAARTIMARVQRRLDAAGEVFRDETPAS